LIVGIISTVIGVVLGALAGYYRGWIDQLIMRLTDVIIIIPLLVLGAVLGRTIGGDAILLAAMLGLIAWTGMARLVRAEFLSLREREFVDAARVAGASDFRIIFRHILPNTVGVIVVSATLLMSAVILLETSLSFLGFGIKSPDISLGQIISEYNEAFKTRPWLFWWPGLFIVAIALCINFIGDGLRDAFDPRQKRVPKQGGAGADVVRFFKSYIPGARPGNENVNK
jgi:ABC-type dipeptide/oligopeptide/nickel transport system permease subunit